MKEIGFRLSGQRDSGDEHQHFTGDPRVARQKRRETHAARYLFIATCAGICCAIQSDPVVAHIGMVLGGVAFAGFVTICFVAGERHMGNMRRD